MSTCFCMPEISLSCEHVQVDRLVGDLAQRDDRVLVVVAIDGELARRPRCRARAGRRSRTSSKRLGTFSTQSSTVTRAMDDLPKPGRAAGNYDANAANMTAVQQIKPIQRAWRQCGTMRSATWSGPAGRPAARRSAGRSPDGASPAPDSASGSRTKAALGHARMRQQGACPARPAPFRHEVKQIEIERPGALGTVRRRPNAASTACSTASSASARQRRCATSATR